MRGDPVRYAPRTAVLGICVTLLASFPLAAQQGHQLGLREAVTRLRSNPNDDALRWEIIRIAQLMNPEPGAPGDAEEHAGRAAYLFRNAAGAKSYQGARIEYDSAIAFAPWVADLYFNRGLVLEQMLAEHYSDYYPPGGPVARVGYEACTAARSFRWYLAAEPNADNAREVQQRIGALDVRENCGTGRWWNPLLWAAEWGDVEAVRSLVGQGADVNKGSDGTPLHTAARTGVLEIVRLLVENGAVVNTTDSDHETPLMYAAARGHTAVVEYLVERGADVNARERFGLTALHYGAEGQSLAIVRLLLAKGADVNARDSTDASTPLHIAAFYGGSLEIVRVLVANGADVNATKIGLDSGGTALKDAAFRGYLPIVQFLVERGADVNRGAALSAAISENHTRVANFLRAHGAH